MMAVINFMIALHPSTSDTAASCVFTQTFVNSLPFWANRQKNTQLGSKTIAAMRGQFSIRGRGRTDRMYPKPQSFCGPFPMQIFRTLIFRATRRWHVGAIMVCGRRG
jgi:hypothetical protein